ncbi:hypothetical protein [Candidatus Lucifugimonas marina]|jgi:hypothetical protein|uniref:Uncharacterized protein n=1 Tax=Candidatus Lucifugimonas marina TaxID=3038979 RepID=A0AAJ5ZEW3_9CHLR|nr:hypothetical protein [SAR202 cluster bacterium JH702]MDG0870470.1 hypothetical protein [SAR202 cluster bacterium JH639]WFG35980.1 hypothetical protein GKN94_09850 [SAR202 cluster bacterium JH545]WFG39924.1 hypothetical protein GKO48_09955 [SAR202 cluster bacterium JH1073]
MSLKTSIAAVIGIGVVGLAIFLAIDDSRHAAYSESVLSPAYLMSAGEPAFHPDCGEEVFNTAGGGFGYNYDLDHHIRRASIIVEGTARISGPARFGFDEFDPVSSQH